MTNRMLAMLAGLLLAFSSVAASAQARPADPAQPAAAAKKSAPAKAAKKETPVKRASKKRAESKPKAATRTVKNAPKAGDAKAKQPVKVYSTSKSTELRDSQGNIIPTNPEAYDVSSATGRAGPRK